LFKAFRRVSAVTLACALSIGTLLAGAAPAQADNVGHYCFLSDNWKVKFSAAYEPTSGTSSHIHYVVMNSPGPINQWRVRILDNAGNQRSYWNVVDPDQLARIDVYLTFPSPRVVMEVWGGNGACRTTLRAYET
jgi:hypothetical protein